MASSGTGGTAVGLQALGGAAGIAGSLITSQQGKQDKRISGGQEDPAIAALRKRLAAQNAQTAMSVAASQQGVNPALAQRNAQQALAQQQVQTNANLAQNNVQSTLASRSATRGQQHQQIAGTALGIGQGLVGMGTSMGAQAAYDASGTGATDASKAADAANYSAIAAKQGEGAAGLASPLAAGAGSVPQGAGVSLQTQPTVATSNEYLDAFQAADPLTRQNPALSQQMRGGTPEAMGQGLGQIAASPAAGQPIAAPALQEAPVGTPYPAAAPPQAAPQAVATSAPQEVSDEAAPVPPGELTTEQKVQMIPESAYSDPMNAGLYESIGSAEARGNTQMAEILRRALLQQNGML